MRNRVVSLREVGTTPPLKYKTTAVLVVSNFWNLRAGQRPELAEKCWVFFIHQALRVLRRAAERRGWGAAIIA